MEVHTASIKARILENERKTSAPLQTAMSLVLSPVQCARAASAYRVRPCASMALVLREPSADLNRLVPGSLARPAPHVQGRRVCSEGCVLPDMATVNPAVRTDPPVPAAAHLQTRVLFHRFIPSASASRSPFAAPNADVPIPVPTFAPEGELTADKVDEHIAGAFEIAEFLRRNVVQGVKNDEGNFCEHSLVRFCFVVSRADWIEPVSILPPFAISPRFLPLPVAQRSAALTDPATTPHFVHQLYAFTTKLNAATTNRSERPAPTSRPRSKTSTCAGDGGERTPMARLLQRRTRAGVGAGTEQRSRRRQMGSDASFFARISCFPTAVSLPVSFLLAPARDELLMRCLRG